MDERWNSELFNNIQKNELKDILNDISLEDQILVIQDDILPRINNLFTFTELTQLTPIRKILIINDNLSNELSEISKSLNNSLKIVFLIDIRKNLKIDNILLDFFKKKKIKTKSNNSINIIYCSETFQRTNLLLQTKKKNKNSNVIPHFIKSQLSPYIQIFKVFNWNILPINFLDIDILNCDLLFDKKTNLNSLYSPNLKSFQSASRSILLDNLVQNVLSLLKVTNTVITNSISIGYESKKFIDILKERIDIEDDLLDNFIKESIYTDKHCGIETDLIVIDRDIDPITPLLTQLTYAGLLDDIFGFNDFDGKKLIYENDTSFDYKVDFIWNDLKFLNFSIIGPRLNTLAKSLQDKYDSRHNADTIGEIKNFVDSLGSLQERQKLLKLHTTLSSEILENVEKKNDHFNSILTLEQDILLNNIDYTGIIDQISKKIWSGKSNEIEILRLLCLSAICKNGLRDKDLDYFRTEFIDNFGFNQSFNLERLSQRNLFFNKTMFNDLKRQLTNLYSDNNNNDNNEDNKSIIFNKLYSNISVWLDTSPYEEDGPQASNNYSSLNSNNKNSNSTSNDPDLIPKNLSFAYCGIVPLTTRIIQSLYDRSVVTKNFSAHQPFIISKESKATGLDTLFGQIYGDTKIIQQEIWNTSTKGKQIKKRVMIGELDKKQKDISLIVFIGGITLGEIATIKALEKQLKQKGINKRFVIICDGITNSKKYLSTGF